MEISQRDLYEATEAAGLSLKDIFLKKVHPEKKNFQNYRSNSKCRNLY